MPDALSDRIDRERHVPTGRARILVVNSSFVGRLVDRLLRALGLRRERPRTGEVETGTVAFWHTEEGWGALRTPARRGVGFAHFSHIDGVDGYRELFPNEPVQFEWADDFEQDGCQWRVNWVRPAGRA
jgi:cold shock CspA family protein